MKYASLRLSTLDENVLDRELRPLQKINDSYPKYLLTMDTLNPTANYNGIKKINILNWLLQ